MARGTNEDNVNRLISEVLLQTLSKDIEDRADQNHHEIDMELITSTFIIPQESPSPLHSPPLDSSPIYSSPPLSLPSLSPASTSISPMEIQTPAEAVISVTNTTHADRNDNKKNNTANLWLFRFPVTAVGWFWKLMHGWISSIFNKKKM